MPTLKVWDGSAWVEVKGDKGDPGEVTNADMESRVAPIEGSVSALDARVVDTEVDIGRLATQRYDVRAYGSIGTSDDSATFQAAMDTVASGGGGTVVMPQGTYTMQNVLNIPNGVLLDLNGSTLSWEASALPGLSKLVNIQGSESVLPALGSSISNGDDHVTFADAHGLAVGDWFCAYNTADYSFNSARPYYRQGMAFRVVAVDSTTVVRVHIRSVASFSSGGGVTMHKMTPATGGVTNGKIVGTPGVLHYGVWAELTAGLKLSNLEIISCEYALAYIHRSVNVTLDNIRGEVRRTSGVVGDNYGIDIANCQHVTVSDCHVQSEWHAFDFGGRTGPWAIPNRFAIVEGNHFTNVSDMASVDVHGNSEYIKFSDNMIYGGIAFGGDNIEVIDNTITGYSANLPPVYSGSELIGPNIVVQGNRIIVLNPHNTSFGFMYLALNAPVSRQGKMLIDGNALVMPHGTVDNGAVNRGIYINRRPECTVNDIDIRISGNTVHCIAGNNPPNLLSIAISGADNLRFRRVEVMDNDLAHGRLYIENYCAMVTRVSRNTSQSPTGSAISINKPTTSPYNAGHYVLEGNIVFAPSSDGVVVNTPGTVVLDGNDVFRPTGAAYRVTNASYVVTRGNHADTTGVNQRANYATCTRVLELHNSAVGSGTVATSGVATYKSDPDVGWVQM